MPVAAPAPQTVAEVQARYQELRALHQQRYDVLASKHSNALKAIAAIVLLIFFQIFRTTHSTYLVWLLPIGIAAIVALTWYTMSQQTRIAREQRLLVLYDRNLSRANGTETQSGRTGTEPGQELRVSGHLYERDLDILGPNSLFGLLDTARTGPGERGLANYLLHPASHEDTLRRQASIKELLPQTELREHIALLGASSFQQIAANFFDTWLDDAPPIIHPIYRPILFITSTTNVALLLVGMLHYISWNTIFPNLVLSLCVQTAIALYLRPRVLPLLTTSARLQQHVRLMADGIALMQATHFDTPKLKELQRLSLEPAGAIKLLKSLESQLNIVEQRTKEYFMIFSLLLAAGTQAAIAIAKWKHAHSSAMRSWLSAWSEFEALNALATYAYEHPDYAWPDLLPPTHPPLYEAIQLAHPLLANAVANDISLGGHSRFYLISGSNMSGKSTLLRAIGINAVLAYAGAPVRAASLRLTPLTLGASLALTDSLAEGRSKFLAEVERLSAIIKASDTAPVLFLVDEIFSGTNSEDRSAAARSILEKLLANQAIGALSTHDLALTVLANPANTGLNVHMASPSPDDPLAFDYKLKPGINTSSSALAILRLIGL